MFSYELYSFLHIFGVIILFYGVGGLVTHLLQGGSKESLQCRKCIGIHHGVALVMILVSGFGMMARMHYSFGDNKWLFVKIACWLIMGGFTALAYKRIIPTNWLWWVGLSIAGTAVTMVVFKPF